MTEAYPLAWPVNKPRTKRPQSSRFQVSFAKSRDGLLNELELMGARHVVISTNVALRRDGLPYANQAEPNDRGVAVYFLWKGKQHCFACDRWDKVRYNLRAIEHTIAALRGIERWGTGDMVDAAFTGFLAIEAPRSWRNVLQVNGFALADAEDAYKKLAKKSHPDRGGSDDAMAELNWAIQRAREEIG